MSRRLRLVDINLQSACSSVCTIIQLMVSDKVGDLYVNYSNNHIGSDPVVINPGPPGNGQNDYSQQWAEYYR